jgi:hypothetical protein
MMWQRGRHERTAPPIGRRCLPFLWPRPMRSLVPITTIVPGSLHTVVLVVAPEPRIPLQHVMNVTTDLPFLLVTFPTLSVVDMLP